MPGRATYLKTTILRCAVIGALATLHFLADFIATAITMNSYMSRDTGPQTPFSLAEQGIEALAAVLHFPILTFWPDGAVDRLGYLAWPINSLLWAVCIFGIGTFLRRNIRSQ
jgi:hypothetical protein